MITSSHQTEEGTARLERGCASRETSKRSPAPQGWLPASVLVCAPVSLPPWGRAGCTPCSLFSVRGFTGCLGYYPSDPAIPILTWSRLRKASRRGGPNSAGAEHRLGGLRDRGLSAGSTTCRLARRRVRLRTARSCGRPAAAGPGREFRDGTGRRPPHPGPGSRARTRRRPPRVRPSGSQFGGWEGGVKGRGSSSPG